MGVGEKQKDRRTERRKERKQWGKKTFRKISKESLKKRGDIEEFTALRKNGWGVEVERSPIRGRRGSIN